MSIEIDGSASLDPSYHLWVYIWCFKAICQEGLLNATVRGQLKRVIEEYKLNRATSISEFEGKIIDQALEIN